MLESKHYEIAPVRRSILTRRWRTLADAKRLSGEGAQKVVDEVSQAFKAGKAEARMIDDPSGVKVAQFRIKP